MAYRILAINLGSTSTKLAFYEDNNVLYQEVINHATQDLAGFPDIFAQYDYRLKTVMSFLNRYGISHTSLDAVVSRGALTHPVAGGVYRINESMLEEAQSGRFGTHACNLSSRIAYGLCKNSTVLALVVDPPVTDEFEPLARLSGLPQVKRSSQFHALNQRAVGQRLAQDLGKNYADLRLIVVHLGGGISVAAHKYGKMVDATNAVLGEGPFSPERSGALPAKSVLQLGLSGQYSQDELGRLINGKGGLTAYLQTGDVREVERLINEGHPDAAYILEGMCYQIAKEVGAMATVLAGDVHAIAITGGIAYSQRVVDWLTARVQFIAPVYIYPGEDEMEALAFGAWRVLTGQTIMQEFTPEKLPK